MSEAEIRRLLRVLSIGRGRHAPMAYKQPDGRVLIYRGGRRETYFELPILWASEDKGLVERLPSGRYRITVEGRSLAKRLFQKEDDE